MTHFISLHYVHSPIKVFHYQRALWRIAKTCHLGSRSHRWCAIPRPGCQNRAKNKFTLLVRTDSAQNVRLTMESSGRQRWLTSKAKRLSSQKTMADAPPTDRSDLDAQGNSA